MHFLRVVRFDQSDENVFEIPAIAGEFAVSGGFQFSDFSPEEIVGKIRQAFANGFLGIGSFGRSTFVCVSEMTQDEHDKLIATLADYFMDKYGAPDLQAATSAAKDEIGFVMDLCDGNPVNTIFSVSRSMDDEGIHEEFRIITPSTEAMHTPIWKIVEDDA